MPRLTEYLLKLATDAEELEQFRTHGHQEAETDLRSFLMQQPKPGLTAQQADAIASRDGERIRQAVQEELIAEQSDPEVRETGLSVAIYCPMHHITLTSPPAPPRNADSE